MKPTLTLCRMFAFVLAFAAVAPGRAADGPKKLLVVTVSTGFRHSSIPTAEKILTQMAAESGRFTVDFVRQPAGMAGVPGRPRSGAKGEDDPAFQAALEKYAADQKAYDEGWIPKAAVELGTLSPANLK